MINKDNVIYTSFLSSLNAMSFLNDELKDIDILKPTTFAKTMSFFGIACLKTRLNIVSKEDVYHYIAYCEKWINEQNDFSLNEKFIESFDVYVFAFCNEFLNNGDFLNTSEIIGYVSHFMKLLDIESDAVIHFSIAQILTYCIKDSYNICSLAAKEKIDTVIQT